MSIFESLFGTTPDPTLAARMVRVEKKLDLVIAHLGIELPPAGDDGMDDIREVARDPSRKILAIKMYRERTGVGLAEAKAAVDAMAAGNG